MKAVEDFESRLHEAVSFVVERDNEIQEWKEQKLPKVLPGYIGGRLPGRRTEEAGGEEEEEKEKNGEGRIRRTSPKKWLRASRKRQARTKTPSRP